MILETIWFFLWGLLWAVFFMTDGFDFGIGTLYPFLGKTDTDKRIMINSLGPLWDGNEVWLITAGGVTFAAFPMVYAVMFSQLYAALMLILFALIIRGVSFEFRGKVDDPRWRKVWDVCIFIGSAAPALLFGVAFANIFRGLPIDEQGILQGNLLTLLNPYGLLGGVFFLLMFTMHGALWLCFKTEGELQARTVWTVKRLWPVLALGTVIFLLASRFATNLYANYADFPALFIVIPLAVTALFGIEWFVLHQAYFKAWAASAFFIVSCTFFGIIGLYPNMLPSSLGDNLSLTAHNAASTQMTLTIMLVVVILVIPVVIAYQVWTYNLFKDKVTAETIAREGIY